MVLSYLRKRLLPQTWTRSLPRSRRPPRCRPGAPRCTLRRWDVVQTTRFLWGTQTRAVTARNLSTCRRKEVSTKRITPYIPERNKSHRRWLYETIRLITSEGARSSGHVALMNTNILARFNRPRGDFMTTLWCISVDWIRINCRAV